ncbi:MAG: hypothetical protein C5B59_01305 [Bacteroidetes bacterium]|nr:MAG: hypothetical protein C5B59_01305 [Bacteroidota bacterium]
MTKDAQYWIQELNLREHVEGGYYREIYRSSLIIPQSGLPFAFAGDRHASTSIYFLLKSGSHSAFHRILSDETWHFYSGGCLLIYEMNYHGLLRIHRLGNNPEKDERFQVTIEAGNWFGARPDNGTDYALVGCTVAPGFDFADFELANAAELSNQFPTHRNLIMELSVK